MPAVNYNLRPRHLLLDRCIVNASKQLDFQACHRMNRWVVVCLLAMSCIAIAQTHNPTPFRSVYAAQDISLDTNPDSEFWRGALPTYAEVDSLGRAAPLYRTEVKSRWTKKNLYLLYICPYEELNLKPSPNTAAETNKLWNWDVAELFIGSDFENIRRYREFEVSPQGEWLDLDIDLDLPDHTVGWTWNSGFRVAARIDARSKRWYAAMQIPFTSIAKQPPVSGDNFRANLFRSQGPPGRQKQIAWRAPLTETFHTPERFGLLELVEGK